MGMHQLFLQNFKYRKSMGGDFLVNFSKITFFLIHIEFQMQNFKFEKLKTLSDPYVIL